MKKFFFVILFLVLVAPITAYAWDWERVGGDPCTLSLKDSLTRLSMPAKAKDTIVLAFHTWQYRTVQVSPGASYSEMVFGAGKVRQDVRCTWRYTPGFKEAARVIFDYDGYRYVVDRFTRCSNLAWYRQLLLQQTKAPPSPVVVRQQPVQQPTFEFTFATPSGARVSSTAVTPSGAGPLILMPEPAKINIVATGGTASASGGSGGNAYSNNTNLNVNPIDINNTNDNANLNMNTNNNNIVVGQ